MRGDSIPTAVVTLSDRPLPDNRNYRLYQLHINGQLVRQQISAFSRDIIQDECRKLRLEVPAEYAAPVAACPPGRRHIQPTPSQQQQAQARPEGEKMIADTLKAFAPHVKPMIARCCHACDGSGYVELGYVGGTNTTYGGRCSRCNGRGMIDVEVSR